MHDDLVMITLECLGIYADYNCGARHGDCTVCMYGMDVWMSTCMFQSMEEIKQTKLWKMCLKSRTLFLVSSCL